MQWAIPSLLTLAMVIWMTYPRPPEAPMGYGELAKDLRILVGASAVLMTWLVVLVHGLSS